MPRFGPRMYFQLSNKIHWSPSFLPCLVRRKTAQRVALLTSAPQHPEGISNYPLCAKPTVIAETSSCRLQLKRLSFPVRLHRYITRYRSQQFILERYFLRTLDRKSFSQHTAQISQKPLQHPPRITLPRTSPSPRQRHPVSDGNYP
jgi:hypothetical protein